MNKFEKGRVELIMTTNKIRVATYDYEDFDEYAEVKGMPSLSKPKPSEETHKLRIVSSRKI
jgi:hypothetical protein